MIDWTQTGIVFNIQKFSLNDGPGIRTVVFLKGCPLHCLWCANPESQLVQPQILWDEKKCIQCGHCQNICKKKAITIHAPFHIHIDFEQCNLCNRCVEECPGGALAMTGRKRNVKEVMEIIEQDRLFYEESGGGVTLSGGELFMQTDFSLALLQACKEKGIHTAIETSAYVQPDVFDRILPYVDVAHIDVKHWDPVQHKNKTGVSNELPLRNLKHAIEKGVTVIPRIPVIPGFNDSLKDVPEFAGRLKTAGAHCVQLLPFHQLGQNKYSQLNKEYVYADTSNLHPEDLKEYQQAFKDCGIDAYF